MYPVISDRRARICRSAVCVVVTLYSQVSSIVQEADIVLRCVQLGISVRSREERPVCSCSLVFDVVGDGHLLHAGQKASAGSVCNVQPLRGSAVQVKRLTASFIAACQCIASGCFCGIGNDILVCAQIFKVKIQKKFRLDIRGVFYFNIKFRCLFAVSNCNRLCSFCRKVHIAEEEMSRVFGSAVVSDVFRSAVRISYCQDKTCGKKFLRINFVFCLDRFCLHFDLCRSVSVHYSVVFFRCQRDHGSMTFVVRIKVEIFVVCFNPFCICNICRVERNIPYSAVVVRQKSVGRHFLAVHFFPVILIVCKQFRSFQAGLITGQIADQTLFYPYILICQPLAAVRTFFHTDCTVCSGTAIVVSFAVS